MSYRPTTEDAMGVYLAAAAHQYKLPIEAIDQPGLWSVEESGYGSSAHAFSILNPRDRHTSALHSVWSTLPSPEEEESPTVAICTYNYEHELWEVDLWAIHIKEMVENGIEKEPLLVRHEGNSFAVVTDDEFLAKFHN